MYVILIFDNGYCFLHVLELKILTEHILIRDINVTKKIFDDSEETSDVM